MKTVKCHEFVKTFRFMLIKSTKLNAYSITFFSTGFASGVVLCSGTTNLITSLTVTMAASLPFLHFSAPVLQTKVHRKRFKPTFNPKLNGTIHIVIRATIYISLFIDFVLIVLFCWDYLSRELCDKLLVFKQWERA